MIYDGRTWKKDLRKCIAQLKWLKKLKYYHALDFFFTEYIIALIEKFCILR